MLVYFIDKTLKSNIISSQVLPLAKTTYKGEYIFLIHKSNKKKIKYLNINIRFYSRLRDFLQYKNVKEVYVRDIKTFFFLYLWKILRNKKYNILYDFRGLLNEESFYRNNSLLRKKILFHVEKFIARKADRLHTVSNKFKEYLVNVFKTNKDIQVVPCCSLERHPRQREKEESIKFVYIGGMSSWQKPKSIAKLCQQISQQIPNAHFSVITGDVQQANAIFNPFSIPNIEIKSVPHHLMSKELRKYDFGFLLRDDIPLNNVASPIKFVEYISNGVIPIVSPGIGDFSELVTTEKIGIVYKFKDSINKEEIFKFLEDPDIEERLYKISTTYLWSTYYELFWMRSDNS